MIPWFVGFFVKADTVAFSTVNWTYNEINVCNICQFYYYLTKTSFKIINMIVIVYISTVSPFIASPQKHS